MRRSAISKRVQSQSLSTTPRETKVRERESFKLESAAPPQESAEARQQTRHFRLEKSGLFRLTEMYSYHIQHLIWALYTSQPDRKPAKNCDTALRRKETGDGQHQRK